MKTHKEVKIGSGGKILRIERKIDHRGVPHARLHVINLGVKRGSTEGMILWVTQGALVPLIGALGRIVAGGEFQPVRVPLEAGRELCVDKRSPGGMALAWISVEGGPPERSNTRGPIYVPAVHLPDVIDGLMSVASSFGLEVPGVQEEET